VSISECRVPDPDAELLVVLRQVLGHALRQRRHEHALAARRHAADLGQQVVDLAFDRPTSICGSTSPSAG
jgi:hypothetical protein